MRIGILNSGGDCSGLNAVIHGVVGAASKLGWEGIGFRDSFEGLLPLEDYQVLNSENTMEILKLGGTILGTTNKGHFAAKVSKDGETKEQVAESVIEKAVNKLRTVDLEGEVVETARAIRICLGD